MPLTAQLSNLLAKGPRKMLRFNPRLGLALLMLGQLSSKPLLAEESTAPSSVEYKVEYKAVVS